MENLIIKLFLLFILRKKENCFKIIKFKNKNYMISIEDYYKKNDFMNIDISK